MNSESPGWQPVDPTGARLSASLPDAPGPGEVVVFASSATEGDRGWVAETVAEVTREWAGSVERLFLMDLDLVGAGIHEALGAEAGEGTTDVLLFGASVSRVAQVVGGGTFHFAPSGTPVADPRVILSNSRWDRVIQGFQDAGIPLVLHLPLRQPGSASLLARADRIVRLGRPTEGEEEIPSELGDRVVATLTPPEAVAEAAVDIGDLAPDEPVGVARPPDEGAGIPADRVGIEEETPPFPEEPSPEAEVGDRVVPFGPETGEVEETASHEAVTDTDEVAADPPASGELGAEPGAELGEAESMGPVVDIGDLAPDVEEPEEVSAEEAPGRPEAGMALEGAVEEAVAEARTEPAEGEPVELGEPEPEEPGTDLGAATPVGPVVDIADLAPDEPVGVARSPEEGLGIPGDQAGVEGEPGEFPDEPSPEAEVEDRVVPFGPETGEVEEVSEGASSDTGFEDDAFAAGLDAIDEAAAAGKQRGLEAFDLEGLDELSDPTGRPDEDEAGEGAGGLEEELPEAAFEEAALEEADPGAPERRDGELGGPGIEAGEESEGEAEEEALDFGGFSGELDLAEGALGGSEEDESEAEGAGFEGAGGAGEEPIETGGESRADERLAPGPYEDETPAPGPTGESGLGDDLVTGPDFGEGAPEVDEIWDDEPSEPEERGSGAAAGAGAGSAADRRAGPRERAEGGVRNEETGAGGEEGARGERRPTGGEETPRLVGTESGPARRDRRSGRPLRLLVLALILAVGAVTAHWFGVVDVPGLDRALATVLGPARTGPAPTVVATDPQPSSPIQTQSLLVDVYRDSQSAGEVAMALQDRLPDRVFAVAPVQQEGDVVYRLLAGPANTPQEVTGLRATLSGVLTREDPSQWTPQGTSLAFLIDEMPGLDAARARARAISSDDLFGHVLRVSYPDGSTAYRVYAGGYSSPEEARVLQGILSQSGIRGATFTERRGEVPE